MAAALAALLVLVVALGCGRPDSGVTLVAYSTPREVYEELIPAFQRSAAGEGVEFRQTYGPSADQSRIVEQGLAGDVLALSMAPDITRLEDDGLVDPSWQNGPTAGFVSTSVVVFIVRPGNPLGIAQWDDLIADGVEVVTPNPLTSGGAQWNIAAAYGAQLEVGRSHREALDFLAKLFDNVPVQPKGAREALQVFRAGKGDVMIAYENEAITAQQKGEPVDYVIPDQTILIQNPIAVSTEAVDPIAARAFVDFALTSDGQRIFAQKGYRPVHPRVLADFRGMYPEPRTLFTIDGALGGWGRFRDEFFAPGRGFMINIFAGRDPESGDV